LTLHCPAAPALPPITPQTAQVLPKVPPKVGGAPFNPGFTDR
jgi:hypothetical protein